LVQIPATTILCGDIQGCCPIHQASSERFNQFREIKQIETVMNLNLTSNLEQTLSGRPTLILELGSFCY